MQSLWNDFGSHHTAMSVAARTRLALCLFALLAWCHGAMAQDWNLVGLGKHQETGRDIYLGGIYLKTGSARPSDLSALTGPWKMEYRIVARRTSIRSLLGSMLLQSEVATGRAPGPATTEFADGILSAIKSSLYAGDAFDIELEGNVTYALLNGQILARSSNPGVASYFLAGWISEQGPAGAFREALLAPEIDPELLAQHNALKYSEQRSAEIAGSFGVPATNEPALIDPASTAGGLPAQSLEDAAAVTPLVVEATPAPGAPFAANQDTPPTAATIGPLAADLAPATTEALPPATDATTADRGPLAAPLVDTALLAEIPQTTLAGPGVIGTARLPAEMVLQPVQPFSQGAGESPAPTAADEVMALGVQEYSQRLATFQSNMVARVYSKIRYPKRAVRRSLQGRLEIDVVLSGAGELRNVEVASSSGHAILDNAAVDAAEDAFRSGVDDVDPVARAEFGVGPDELIVPVPVQFRLE
ncbi:MAG: TonB family protein [Halioglobus sp.]|nr:TonB family protein [Halioglobus sp.]